MTVHKGLNWLLVGAVLSPLAIAAAHVQAKPQSKDTKKSQQTTKPVAKPPKPLKSSDVIAMDLPTPSSSLVRDGQDAARHWITPLLPHLVVPREGQKIEFNVELTSIIHMINPDSAKSVRVRVICHDQRGKSTPPIEVSIAPLAVGLHGVVESSWCRLDAPAPILAYGEIRDYTRNPVESYTKQRSVQFFKASP